VERGPDEEVSADHLQGDLRMTWTTWAVRVSVFVDGGAIIKSNFGAIMRRTKRCPHGYPCCMIAARFATRSRS
jgi:hypothetical protein